MKQAVHTRWSHAWFPVVLHGNVLVVRVICSRVIPPAIKVLMACPTPTYEMGNTQCESLEMMTDVDVLHDNPPNSTHATCHRPGCRSSPQCQSTSFRP
jgi:hypothetical protein